RNRSSPPSPVSNTVAEDRTARETVNIPRAEAQANGSAYAFTSSDASGASNAESSSTWCLIPRDEAVARASAASSHASPGVLIVKASMSPPSFDIAQHTRLESMPPLSNAPTGTSACRRFSTAARNRRSVSCSASSNEGPGEVVISGGDQYLRVQTIPPDH